MPVVILMFYLCCGLFSCSGQYVL